MRKQWVIYLGIAMLAGVIGGGLLAPAPVGAVAREIVELQQSVNQLIQGQQALQTQLTQNEAVEKTLIEQSLDSVNRLSGTMNSLQKSVQDLQANSGARLDSMSTQVQGVSDNLQELLARMGKLNQQLTDIQNSIQGIDSKLSTGAPGSSPTALPGALPNAGAIPGTLPSGPGGNSAAPYVPAATPAGSLPSADLLYSNGLRDLNGKKYDLATQEFQDYLKYYPGTELASNAEFYLGEIAYAQEDYPQAIEAYSKVIDNYPRSFKLAPAHLKKGLALVASGQKASGIRELRAVISKYPGTDEERRARAKLHDMGLTA
jgi:tol-pal system protein YbgF